MLLFAAPATYASPELSQSVATRWRGHVDRFDPLSGIEGWALAIDEPGRPLTLELVVGEDAFAIAETGRRHGEIDARLARGSRAGFRFEPDVVSRLARLSPHRRDRPVHVRIAGTDVRLAPAAGTAPTLGDVVDAWRAAVVGAMERPEPAVTKGDRLLARLGQFRAEAQGLALKPLRPLADGEIGQIEAVYPAAEGQVWFLGWMKRGVEPEWPAVILDRHKFPAGIAVLHFERQDLPTSAVGVIGVMDTGWMPPVLAKDGFVYVGRQGQFHLRFGEATRLLRVDAFLAAHAQVQAGAGGANAEAIASIFGSGAQWMPGNAGAAGLVCEGGIDRLLMMPGFGCVAEGWAVSPAKRVETFHMKIGDCVMVADDTATAFRARPDLQAVFGNGASVTARAGFCAVLRGALPAHAGGVPLLRVVHDDGSMAVLRGEAKTLRRFDPVLDGDEVLRLLPSFRHEAFYPAFLDAARRMIADRLRTPQALGSAPVAAERLIVMRLPAEEANLRFVFDRIARHLPDLEPGTGLCLLADQGPTRTDSLLRFEELKAETPGALSLFGLHHGEDALDELPWLLTRLGAERFVYVGRGIALTGDGWRAAGRSLLRRGHFVDRFEIVDDTGRPDRVDGAIGAACFGWSTAALLGWSLSAPRFLRGLFRGSGLPEHPLHDRVLPGAALRLERRRASRFADMVDEDLLTSASSPTQDHCP